MSEWRTGKRVVLPFVDGDLTREGGEDELPARGMGLVGLANVAVVPNVYDEGWGVGGAGMGEDFREVGVDGGGSGDADRGCGEHGDLDVEQE